MTGKNSKRSALVASVLAIALCAAIIAGATFALYTSGFESSLTVTAGNVRLEGDVTLDKAWSTAQESGEKTEVVPQNGSAAIAATGSSVALDEETGAVTFKNIGLGDGAQFTVKLALKNTVNMKYAVILNVGTASAFFRENLAVSVANGAGENKSVSLAQGSAYLLDWTEEPAGTATDKRSRSFTFTVELPWAALANDNAYGDKPSTSRKLELDISVRAVQSNAYTGDFLGSDGTAYSSFEQALEQTEDGGIITVGPAVEQISLPADIETVLAGRTLTVQGAGVDVTTLISEETNVVVPNGLTLENLTVGKKLNGRPGGAIRNVKVAYYTTGKRYSLFVNNPSGTQSAEPFLVDNCDMSDISVSKGAAVEIRNMNIDESFYVTASAGSQVTLKDSTIKNSSKSNTLVSRTENFVAENCTIIAEQAYCVSAVDGGMIELNGCDLTAQAEGKTAIAANGENSRVVIEDCDVTALSSPLFAYNGGKITLESGNVSSSKKSGSILVQTGYSGQGSGTFEMNGGVLDASTPGSSAVFMEEDSLVTITGGSVKADTFALSTNNTTGGDVVVNISGGEIIAANAPAIYMPIGKELNISGGSVCGTAAIDARIGAVNLSGNAVLTATKAQAEPLRFDSYNEPQGVNGGSSADGAVIILNGNLYTANGTVKALSLTIEEGVTLNSASGEYVHVYDWNRLEEEQSVSVNAGSYAVKNYFYDGNEEGTVTEKA